MGEVPDWYPLLRAAKYLGVAPWDLIERPSVWKQWALMSERAENEAQKQKQESAKRKAGKQ